ncbi:MAG: hypothetical protein V4449_00425 [Patescibacteria group bacterium]
MNQIRNIGHFFASSMQPNPERHWFLVLVIALVPFLFFIAYAGYIFFGIQSGLIVNANVASFPAQVVTSDEIDSVLTSYRIRKAMYDANSELPLPIVDPALIVPARK